MPYCTVAQLTDRYGAQLLLQLSDRGDAVATEIDTDLFDRAIADGDAMIDGYLARRYALPLETTPALITDLSQVIAIYKAHGQTVSDKIREDYQTALKQLRDIGDGKITLDVAGAEPAAAGTNEVRTNEPERPFTPSKMTGFI
ncbi:MAG: DUF1320 domain-containing protein [Nitratireductor sp.]|nr:DUF1320 domain-containing protein [Nitratireductor sp.]